MDDAMGAGIVHSSHEAIVAVDTDLRIRVWNRAAEQLYGYPAEEARGQPLELVIPPDRRADEREILGLIRVGARLDRYRTRRLRRDGTEVSVSVSVSPVADKAGNVIGMTSAARPLSERERLEASLQALLEAAPDAIIGVAPDDRVVLANTQAEGLFGLARHGLIGRRVAELLPDGLPPERPRPAAGGVPQPAAAMAARRHDGDTVPVEITVSIIDTDHGPVRCAVIRDVSERLQAQAEQARLRAEADRIRLEARLQRTQRLESLGQLAGGIAHDFNNLVAVILNYTAFIVEDAERAGVESIVRDAQQVIRAGQRGADLTHQLLAFARREVVRPRVLDLNQVVTDVEKMLRRSLGEHITLVTRLSAELPPVSADSGQLEQVLVNLAVNARDAMPRGGRLTIDTCVHDVDADYAVARPNLEPGRHVRLRVSDTGTGMPREVAERAFEPFFTTKASGEGTGLGLATVYGVITQAGGDVHIYSEPGMGTSVNILLPVTEEPAAHPAAEDPVNARAGQGETVLVVEDEPALRQVACRILTAAGYRVLPAGDGAAALSLVAGHGGAIDLLLTDVVMPGMLGKELAERLVDARPATRVLYMSGYAQPVLASQGTLDPDVVLLEKPFTKPELLAAVRRRLDGA
ncbi:MAG TPA: PAS domain S-box protein [Pilimelia sp.]|nr:PAS domain S-box protein [Pilimelia sp.]